MCFIALCLCAMIFLLLRIRPPSVYTEDGGDKEVLAEGIVSDKYFKNDSFYLVLSKAHVIRGKTGYGKKFDILVKIKDGDKEELFRSVPAGVTCAVSGKIYFFEQSRNPGQFDMALYEKYKGIDFEITSAGILSVSGRPDIVKERLLRLKNRLSRVYDRLFDEEKAGVIKAMVLGDKNSLSPEIKDLYQRAGISHSLSISGLHISILGCLLYTLLCGRFSLGPVKSGLYLPGPCPALISSTILILYGYMTGMGISVKRAIIMFIMMLAAKSLGRSYDMLSSLAFSSLILMLQNPYCIYDTSFILSFGAVIGTGLFKPVTDFIFPRIKGPFSGIAESVKLSLSISVFTLPMVLYFFYRVPLYSVFLNLILIPLMGVLLVFSVICGLTGLISLEAAALFSYICRLILNLYEGVCRINDKLPYSVLVKGRPGMINIIVFYIFLCILILFVEKKRKDLDKCGFKLLIGLIITVVFIIYPINITPKLQITMLDIGQGDCGYIGTGGKHTILIDCGSSDEEEIAKYKVIPFLRSMGRSVIDIAVVSHADNDHISGFKELLLTDVNEGMKIKRLIMPDTAMKDDAYTELAELAKRAEVDISIIKTGDSFTADGVTFTCLHPDSGYACSDRNEYSTVLSVTYKGVSALFTGDIEGRGEEILTQRIKSGYTLLKCAHHGSDNSTSGSFLEKAHPQVTFISAGRDNTYGHPGNGLLKRLENAGSRVFVTKDSGALTFKSDGRRVRISTFR